jgi:hypothetical protein
MELPDLGGRAEIVRRYAHLLEHFGAEIGRRPLVRHDGEYFPDPFEKDEASVARLVQRLQSHAGLSDIPVRVRLVSADAEQISAGTGCGSGGCAPAKLGDTPSTARLEEQADGWILNVFDAELHHPVALTAQLSRALARIFLAETSSEAAPVEAPVEVSTDLTCVALGLGSLVLEGSYIYAKSCGGPSVTRLTTLSVGELAVAVSLFIALQGHSPRRALGLLSTTQRVLLSEANDWAASNAKTMRLLATSPGQLATRAPDLSDTRPWLLRLFDRQPQRSEASLEQALSGGLGDAELLRLARSVDSAEGRSPQRRDTARDAEREELKALVDEALRSS